MHEHSTNGFNDPYRYLKEEHRAIVSLVDECVKRLTNH